MEISNIKSYEIDMGNISICRHFRDKTKREDIVKKAVIEAAARHELLTENLTNGIINAKFREPLRQARRSDLDR